jgi:hypothetical protein
VTRAWEAVADVEAARITAVLAVEIAAQDATAVWDSTTIRVKDAEDWAALTEGEAQDRVSMVPGTVLGDTVALLGFTWPLSLPTWGSMWTG